MILSLLNFLQQIDQDLLIWINRSLENETFNWFFPLITDLHKTRAFQLIVPLSFGFLFIKRFGRIGVSLFLGLILSVALSDLLGGIIKRVAQRPRPQDSIATLVTVRSPAGGYSFMSNHATNMSCLAEYANVFFPEAGLALRSVALLIGFSRIYNGVHYPGDVIAGTLFGALIGKLMAFLFFTILSRIKESKENQT